MLQIDCWDVGQGDCTVIHLPGGKLFIIDVGPLNSPLVDWLADRSAHIDTIALTHNDADHAGAIASVVNIHNIKIDRVRIVVDRSKDSPQFVKIFNPVVTQYKHGRFALDRIEVVGGPLNLWTSPDSTTSIVALYPNLPANVLAQNANDTSAILGLVYNGKMLAIWAGDAPMWAVASAANARNIGLLVGPHHGAPSDRNEPNFVVDSGSFHPRTHCASPDISDTR